MLIDLNRVDRSLLLAAFFRGNARTQSYWTSSCDQVVALSVFYTGDLTYKGCQQRFESGYVGPLYDLDGELLPDVKRRYYQLIDLLGHRPDLILGGGNLTTPADPSYTACKLTETGISIVPRLQEEFPEKPTFGKWPDKNSPADLTSG